MRKSLNYGKINEGLLVMHIKRKEMESVVKRLVDGIRGRLLRLIEGH
jgi:hypothetical protein